MAAAPTLSVVTGLWPLAQAATEIGGDKVAVDDVIPPGTDPLAFEPDAAASRIARAAGLVLTVGGGFQPGFERAAAGAPAVVELRSRVGGDDPYVWLDPVTMNQAVKVIADAMAQANPGAGPLYERNAAALQSEVQSTGIDFSSTLSTCPGTTLVTPDGAFASMAREYNLTVRVAGPAPTPETVAALRVELQSGRGAAVFSQPWVDDHGVEQVAAVAGVSVHPVDTLASPPAPGTPASEATYFAQMEHLLGVLSGALGCRAGNQ